MKWALLYVVTAIVTGAYSFYQLMWMIWGAPVNVLSCAALLGAAALFAAGILALFRSRASAWVGLAGAILVWVDYGPLLVVAAFAPYTFLSSLQFHLKFHDYVPAAGLVLGAILLVLATIHTIYALRKKRTLSAATR